MHGKASRATRFEMKGSVGRRHEADGLIGLAGTGAVVVKGTPRALVLRCPDGCGDVLTVNLQPGPQTSWSLYDERRGYSLFPSVWRQEGCKSHFIIWRSRIIWCDDCWELPDGVNDELAEGVTNYLTPALTSFERIAERMGEDPWAVLAACRQLVSRGVVTEGVGPQRSHFRRTALGKDL